MHFKFILYEDLVIFLPSILVPAGAEAITIILGKASLASTEAIGGRPTTTEAAAATAWPSARSRSQQESDGRVGGLIVVILLRFGIQYRLTRQVGEMGWVDIYSGFATILLG